MGVNERIPLRFSQDRHEELLLLPFSVAEFVHNLACCIFYLAGKGLFHHITFGTLRSSASLG